MLEKDLEALIHKIQSINTELNYIEVKEAHSGCPTKLYDTLSSFSNLSGGGIILFGLKEEKTTFSIVGVYNAADLQKKITAQCNQMQPKVRALFTCITIDNKTILAAEIPEIDISDKPCFYSGKGRLTGSYIRVGDSDERMTEYEIYSYEAFRKNYQDDIRVISDADFELLDTDRLKDFIHILKRKKPKLKTLPSKRIYELFRITKSKNPTLAGLMMFGKYPQGLLPQFCITAIVVPGNEVGDLGIDGERFIDNKRIDGTLPEMLEEAIQFIQNNISIKTIIEPRNGKRMDKEEYPIIAIREIILNALIHRDYSIHTEGIPIQILIFPNRLEVINPGGLYGRISINDLGKVQPATRNPALARMMEDLGLTENRYSGIPTIRKVMQAYNLKEPIFLDARGSFKVILYNSYEKNISQSNNFDLTYSNDLLSFCQQPKTREEIANFLGLKNVPYAMRQHVQPLLKEGKLQMLLQKNQEVDIKNM